MGIMTPDPAADNIGDPGQEPVHRVGKRWIASIALANLGLYLGYIGPLIVLLPNQAQAIAGADHKVAVLGWVTGTGAAVAMVANPAAGALFPARPDPLQQAVPWPDGPGNSLLVLILICTAGVVLTAVTGGIVSDRLGRRKLLVTVAGLTIAVPAIMFALWPSWPVTIVAAAILGLGYGVYLSVD